jgi:hypothetical protein
MTGAALFWWWPFIDHFDLYFHYNALSKFWHGIDRRGKNYHLTNATVESETKDLGVIGMQNNSECFLWVYAEQLFNVKKPQESSLKRSGTIKVSNLTSGNYILEIWDTYTGKINLKKTLNIGSGTTEIPLPEFTNDLALKIRQNE